MAFMVLPKQQTCMKILFLSYITDNTVNSNESFHATYMSLYRQIAVRSHNLASYASSVCGNIFDHDEHFINLCLSQIMFLAFQNISRRGGGG